MTLAQCSEEEDWLDPHSGRDQSGGTGRREGTEETDGEACVGLAQGRRLGKGEGGGVFRDLLRSEVPFRSEEEYVGDCSPRCGGHLWSTSQEPILS